MDLSAVITAITAFSLITAGRAQTEAEVITQPTSSLIPNCSCSTPPPAAPCSSSNSSQPTPGLLTVTWTNKCEGTLHFKPLSSDSSLPVCYSPHIQWIVKTVCQNERGCRYESQQQDADRSRTQGYNVTEEGANRVSDCSAFRVKCKAELLPDVQTQLQTYKVMTALLSCVLLVLLLMRFSRPTVTALRKRLSNKRQNRWVGPTQSHSVSYHRGKTAVTTSDGEKRLSYPALERLMIGDISDP